MDTLADLLSLEVYRAFLVFARVAAAVSLLPGFGELAVPPRVRLCIAIPVALALTPTVPGLPDRLPPDAAVMLEQIFAETVAGAFLGLGAKLFLASLQVAGNIAAQAMGLANPFGTDAAGFESGSILSGTLVISGLALLFALDLHYLMIDALVRSYGSWPAAQLPDPGMVAGRYAQLVGGTFRLGVQMAAPFLISGMLFALALGLLSKLAPQIQVFFLFTSLQVALGLFMFALTMAAMMMFWLTNFESAFIDFLRPG